jgi:hypothetical protein
MKEHPMNNLEVCQQCLEPHRLCECKRQQVSNASDTDGNSVGELIGDGLELALDVVTFLPRKARETFESGMGGDFGGAGAGGMWESVTGYERMERGRKINPLVALEYEVPLDDQYGVRFAGQPKIGSTAGVVHAALYVGF